MLGEWVHTVGVAAGIDPEAVSIFTGAVGAPESKLELHLMQFANMQQLDAFFVAIPQELHVSWGRRFGAHVVDGSTVWHVMRACPVRVPASGSASGGGAKAKSEKPTTTDAGADGGDAVAVAAAAAIEKDADKGGFTMPAKAVPRPGGRPTAEQLRQPVFNADDFGETTSAGGGDWLTCQSCRHSTLYKRLLRLLQLLQLSCVYLAPPLSNRNHVNAHLNTSINELLKCLKLNVASE